MAQRPLPLSRAPLPSATLPRTCAAVVLVLAALAGTSPAQERTSWACVSPRLLLQGVPASLTLAPPPHAQDLPETLRVTLHHAGRRDAPLRLQLIREPSRSAWTSAPLTLRHSGSHTAIITTAGGDHTGSLRLTAWPGYLSLLPALLAITMALVTRQVLLSLLLGIWIGAVFVAGPDLARGTLRAVDTVIVEALSDTDHIKVLLFTLFLGGMVGVMSRSGGTLGIVRALIRKATTARRGAVSAWLLGLLVFFDDYANTVIIGPTLRPITDRLRLSREKLAFLVDATAAPVASIALISTWIGTEVGLIGDALRDAGSDMDPYKLFLATIPYRFYPIFTLVLGILVAASGRDWGPMVRAERRARSGRLLRPGAQPLADFEASDLRAKDDVAARAWNAFVPIGVVVLVTLAGLWWTGAPAAASPGLSDIFRNPHPHRLLGDVFGAADSYTSLLWAASAGGLVALLIAWLQRILTLAEGIGAWIAGVRGMLLAAMILTLAWGLGAVCREIGTSPYLVGLLSSRLEPRLLPVLIFVVAALVSFATGTSWGTMAILIPVTVPLAFDTSHLQGLSPETAHRILLGSASSILAGAVFGDHCSPISDTTVLSSMATSCDHMDHVRTQLPYAVLAAIVGITVGDLPSAFGLSPWWSILAGTGILAAVVFLLFRRVPDAAA